MTMALKYQIQLCLRPQEVLLITLSHMDAIREFVKESPAIRAMVEEVYSLLGQVSAE